jgi:hypothetical protein
MLVHRGREEEDFTRDRSDFKDATIIAKRVAELRCYLPYVLEGHWCRLRHLGARRADQLVTAGSARQRLRDLLECAWPAALATATDPLDARTWRAALAVSADPARIVTMGFDAFATTVRDELPRWGVAPAVICASCAQSGRPHTHQAGSSPNRPQRVNAPPTRWLTGITPWARSPTSRPAWSTCSTP